MADIHQLFDGMIATGRSNDQNGSLARPANYSDEALANRFTARHRDDLRFVNTWGRWLVWDGKRWLPDETLIVTDHARGLVRDASGEILESNGPQKLEARDCGWRAPRRFQPSDALPGQTVSTRRKRGIGIRTLGCSIPRPAPLI